MENLKVRGKDSPHHIKRYDFLKRTYGEFSLQDVPARLLKWRGEVQQSHSNSIINGYTIMIRAVFNYLLALELIQKNPITKLRFPKLETKPRDRYLDDAERGLLLKTIAEHRPQILPIILYMLLVPCRVSELVFAKREQYNPDTNTVYIPDSKADMPIYKPVPECLRGYFQSIPVDCPHLFYKQVGERYYIHHNLRHDWGYVLKKAGILDLRLHDLRHISSSDLYELGNLEREIMDIAGWKTPMLTHYRHKNSLRSAQKIIFKAN
ncbi:MAG: tyrosine-type recombinase/integrase [Chitinispirillales bacterium]|nr:tyrosine-type recombinase/integrase [Chitinispirillales bacterium]